MRRPRRQRRRAQTFDAMIPNILTTFALCAGLTALRFSLEGRFEAAVEALIVAAVLDTFDGLIARMLNQTSSFGAQLDSLSDFLSFGIVPAVMLYLWSLNGLGLAGWAFALVFAVCCALRLARFNVGVDKPVAPELKGYFTGVPSPAGAGLVLLPLLISFYAEENIAAFFDSPVVVAIFVVGVAALMVSQVPTFSFKMVRIPHRYRLVTMLGVAIFAAAVVSAPWPTLTVFLAIYLLTLPFGWLSYNRRKQRIESSEPPDAEDDDADAETSGGAVPLSVVEAKRK
jgi:CDP-diacylglycerol---serine O-phosphatidyltransferase